MTRISPFFLLLIFSFLFSTRMVSVAPTWKGTRFIQSGTKTMVTNGAIQDPSNLYTYTYNPAFAQIPLKALGMEGFETGNLYELNLKISIRIQNPASLSDLTIQMNNPTDTTWQQFKVSFIAIDTSLTQIKIDTLSQLVTDVTTINVGTGPRSFSGVYTLTVSPIDPTHKISIVPFLVGLHSKSVSGQHTLIFAIKVKTASSLDFTMAVERTTRLFDFSYHLIIVDRTVAQAGYQVFMDQINIVGNNNTLVVYKTPVYYNLTNLHAGLNSIKAKLVAFGFDKPTFVVSTSGYYSYISVSIWNYRERSCPVAQPYYEITTNLCYDTCLTGFLNSNGPTQKYCQMCSDLLTDCLECSSTTVCTSCANSFTLTSGNCVCPSGRYITTVSSIRKCQLCHSTCLTCNGPNYDNCLSCIPTRTLSSSKCVCPNGITPSGLCFAANCLDPTCQSCSADRTLCLSCIAGFTLSGGRCICGTGKYLSLTTLTCSACHTTCKYCTGPTNVECSQCDRATQNRYLTSTHQCLCVQGYVDVSSVCTLAASPQPCSEPGFTVDSASGACVQICGDGIKINYSCDDGNNEDGDGCSALCQIEEGFVCTENVFAINKKSFCSYNAAILFEVNTTRKDIYANSVSMNLTMKPTLTNVLNNYPDLLSHIQITEPMGLTLSNATYNTKSRFLELSVAYKELIQNQSLKFSLSMPVNTHTYAIPTSVAAILVTPNNKLSADVNTELTYNYVKALKTFGLICMGGGIAMWMLLSFFRKMMGLEYIVMLQLCYFSIALSDYGHAYFGGLQEWQYVNGYNSMSNGIPVAVKVPNHFEIIGYYDYFYVNCNAMIYLCLVNYFLALILYVLSMFSDKSVSRKLSTSAKFFAIDLGFSLIVFSMNNIIVSVASEAAGGHLGQFSYGFNKFILFFTIILFLAQMGGYFSKVHEMNDSILYYHRNKNYCHFYPFVFVLRNLLVMIAVVIATVIGSACSYIAFVGELAYIIAIIAGRPYKRVIDYVRAGFIEFTLLFLLICRLVQANFISNFSEIEPATAQFRQIGALIVYAGMLVGLLLTIASFIYHWWKSRTQDVEIKPELEVEPDKEQESKDFNIEKNMQNSSKVKLSDDAKSKQIIIFDVDENQEHGQVGGSDKATEVFFNQDSRRRLRSQKLKIKNRQKSRDQ